METWDIAFNPTGEYLASGSQSGNVNIWNTDTGEKEASLETHGKFVMSVAYVRSLRLHPPLSNCLIQHPKFNVVAAGGHDGTVHVLDVEHGKHIHKLEGANRFSHWQF